MDLLKLEIERKRRAVAEASSSTGNSTSPTKKKRYLTAAERRRLEDEEAEAEEEALRERQRKRQEARRKRRRKDDDDSSGEEEDGGKNLVTLLTQKYDPSKKRREGKQGGAEEETGEKGGGRQDGASGRSSEAENKQNADVISEALQKLSPDEITNSLRGFGLPIRLFGEDAAAILQRLASAMQGQEAAMLGESEKDEFLLGRENRTRNVFLEKDDDEGRAVVAKRDGTEGTAASNTNTPTKAPKPLTAEEQADPPKRIYRYFKSLLRQWEEDLAQRSDAIKRTAAGKNETKTVKQCKDYIRPLFQMCKRRELEVDMEKHLLKIVTFCEQGEFVRAHDAYLDVAIGRAAWPIGVTMVGIHARSGREKIGSANVAHVMNSEFHRKYLTSVKRLMSYDQRKRVDVDPSKKVTNL